MCVNNCRSSNNMYPLPSSLRKLRGCDRDGDDTLIILLPFNDIIISNH